MNIDTSTLDASALNTHAENAHRLQCAGIGSFIMNSIPTTSIDALARKDALQVLFFAVIFGISLALPGGEKGEKVTALIDAVSAILFRVAPLSVLGAVAYTAGKYGVGSLEQLVSLVVLYYLALSAFVVAVLSFVIWLAGLNIFKFLSYMREDHCGIL